MLRLKKYISLILFTCITLTAFSQKATVRVTIEPSDILIGQQSVMTIEAISPKGRAIQFPVFRDTLMRGIEVLTMEKIDTTMTEVMMLKQRYTITSFDSTLYHIPYLIVLDGKDTLRTNDVGFKVSSPQLSDTTLAYLELLKNQETDSIDFEQLQISDIKDIQNPPFVWQDYIEYLLIIFAVALVILIIAIVAYLIISKRKKGYYFKPKVELPPHVEAFNELEELKAQKLCQRGMEKEYYTKLTDILRHYIERRFGMDAPEMTSDQILQAIRNFDEARPTTNNLSDILQVSDLVKFAKYLPLPDENDLCLTNAYKFVEHTKKEELVQDATQANQPNSPNKVTNS